MVNESIAWLKISWYIWAIAFFEYLNIIDTQFYILSVLLVIDFITWVWKQFVIDRKEIRSLKAWVWIIKKVTILLVFLSVWLMFKWLDIDSSAYLRAIWGILIMAETYSIIQNTYTIRTGKLLPEFDVISLLLKNMWKMIENYLNNKLK